MNLDTAREVADKFFQKSGEIKELSGERNPNFLVTTPVGKFVLKIHSADEVSQIKIQQSALATLEQLVKFQTPITVPATSGELLVDIGEGNFARMLTWIDGDLWSQSQDIGENHKVQLGRLIATVDSQLATVDCTNFRTALDQPFGWNALQANELTADIALIKDADLRDQVSTIFDRISNRTLAKVSALPHQLIHNDASLRVNLCLQMFVGKLRLGNNRQRRQLRTMQPASKWLCLEK